MRKVVYGVILVLLCNCSPKLFKEKWTKIEAPETFKARFETTQGNFDIEAKRVWSPNGVDRLFQLITKNYYQDISIFRVIPNFVAQFGIHNDTLVNSSWERSGIADEPVTLKSDAMTIAFARGGVKSRSNQIFINLKDNYRLDKLAYSGVIGFPVVARVIAGKENVLKFYDGYGGQLGRKQEAISKFGNEFIREKYPKTDFIIKAYILK